MLALALVQGPLPSFLSPSLHVWDVLFEGTVSARVTVLEEDKSLLLEPVAIAIFLVRRRGAAVVCAEVGTGIFREVALAGLRYSFYSPSLWYLLALLGYPAQAHPHPARYHSGI